MADDCYRRSSGCVFAPKYHLVWCPKFRRPVLTGVVATDPKRLLHAKARALGVSIEALEIMPDHVRLFVAADPTDPRNASPISSKATRLAGCARSTRT